MKMKVSDFPEPDVEVWEENWFVIELFVMYSNQWRMAMSGPVGLDYNVIHHALDRKGITGTEYDAVLADIKVIERAALEQIHRKK